MSQLFKDPNQPALFTEMNDPVLNATFKSIPISSVPPEQKWDVRYIELAHKVSEWSKDPSTKIGCVVVGDKGQVLAQGYNGFPRGIEDSEERLDNRETKLKYVVHGEMNAIYNACYMESLLKEVRCTLQVFLHVQTAQRELFKLELKESYGRKNLKMLKTDGKSPSN